MSHRKMLNNRGCRIEPCGRPSEISSYMLYSYMWLTLGLRFGELLWISFGNKSKKPYAYSFATKFCDCDNQQLSIDQ